MPIQEETLDQQSAVSLPRVLAGVFGNRWFLVCLVLLGSFTAVFQLMGSLFNWQYFKLAVPLRKSFDQLDKAKLGQFEFLQAIQVPEAVLPALGTKEYLQWVLHKRGQGRARAEDVVQLFLTYYTGVPDQVPHVPEECYSGSGGMDMKDASFLDIPVPALGSGVTVPMQLLEFVNPQHPDLTPQYVLYTFHVNGQFCPHRRCVQQALSDLTHKHAYFSKLELTFGVHDQRPNKAQVMELGTQFVQTVIPTLVQDHWPDWEAVIEQEKAEQARK